LTGASRNAHHLARVALGAARDGLSGLCLALTVAPASAQESASLVPADKVQVVGQRDTPAPFDAHDSTSVRTLEELRRDQPSSIFDALRDIPNVSTNGGPRAAGMSFNIRGFSDREDVIVKLDGVPKSFEKYRFGGTFIDPELLKSIEVQRGPRIASGSGALGGTVLATTKDAGDLLRPGERWGTQAKLGYGSNNREALASITGYGRPSADTGLVLNVLRRVSGDIELADGRTLPLSSTDTWSSLVKGTALLADGLWVSMSAVGFDDSGLQPYDATGGEPGLFGSVTRTVRDRNLALSVGYTSGPWVNLLATVGASRTHLVDLMRPGDTPFANAVTGNVTDTYDYRNQNIDLANTSRIDGLPFDLELVLGAQWLDNRREVTRQREKTPGSGFEPSIPPGDKQVASAYAQARFGLGPIELIPGLRFDRYESVATGGTAELLQAAGEATHITLRQTTPSLGVVAQLVPGRLWAFYNQIEGFRPPLIDEYFTQGAFGRCTRFLLGPELAPASQVCGALYRPQQSLNREVGLSYGQPIEPWRALFDAKLTAFRIDTDYLLRSIQATSDTTIGQPGSELRRGWEFEASLRAARGYLRASAAQINGTVDEGGGVRVPSDPQPLYNVPGDTRSVSVGWLFDPGFEAGVGYQSVSARRVITGTVAGQDVIGTQEGYALWNLNARWTLSPAFELRLAVDNLMNANYRLSNGFGGGIGFDAPGRNVRIALVAWL
jgi:hemoglobin/transferrin/lactoferrin receptor protein